MREICHENMYKKFNTTKNQFNIENKLFSTPYISILMYYNHPHLIKLENYILGMFKISNAGLNYRLGAMG